MSDSDGEIYGYVARSLNKDTKPKALTFLSENRGAWYSMRQWADGHPSDELIVVEDQLSAIRGSWYLNSVALLGTNLLPKILENIKKGNYATVWVALDPDAFPLSIKMVAELKRHGVNAKVIRLPADLKDMSEVDVVNLLYKYNAGLENL